MPPFRRLTLKDHGVLPNAKAETRPMTHTSLKTIRIWQYFNNSYTVHVNPDGQKIQTVTCNLCELVLKNYKSPTNLILQHLSSVHRAEPGMLEVVGVSKKSEPVL